MEEVKRTDKFIVRDLRPGWLWMAKKALELASNKAGITGVAIYSWLCYHADRGQVCFPSITILAKHCKVSRRTVIRTIQTLENIKLISIEHSQGSKNVYRLLDVKDRHSKGTTGIPGVTSDKADTGVVTPGIPEVVTPGIPEQYIKQQESLNKKITDFFDYFCLKTKKNIKLTPERRRIIQQRLAEGYTLEQLKMAVDNFCADDWPERQRYQDIIYCVGVRNKVDNLEKWLSQITPSRPRSIKSQSLDLNEEVLLKRFRKMPTREILKEFMREVPQASWGQIDIFLRQKYLGSNGVFAAAERELVSEIRTNREKLRSLGEKIGTPVRSWSRKRISI